MDVPPKVTRQQVLNRERAVPAQRASAAVDRQEEATLPVLGAFGEFIENERRRTRNQILGLTLFFLVILVTVIGGALFVGTLFFDQMRKDFEDVQRDLNTVRQQADAAGTAARDEIERVRAQTRNLHENLAQQETALAHTRQELDDKRSEFERELADMKELMALLELENTTLRRDLADVSATLPKLARSVDDMTHRMETAAARAGGSGALPPPPPPPRPALKTLELAIVPRGFAAPITWRVAIPE